jgi:C4-dicarboxylate transporter DctQ subunit
MVGLQRATLRKVLAQVRRSMLRYVHWLGRNIDSLVAGLALTVALYIFAQEMVARWFFNTSLTWSEDLSRVLLVVMVYFGAAAVSGEDRHIRVEFILNALPAAVQRAVRLLIDLACLAFSLLAVWLGIRLVRDTAAIGLSFAHSGFALPVWVAQSCIPVSFGIMAIRIALRIVGYRQPVEVPAENAFQREG